MSVNEIAPTRGAVRRGLDSLDTGVGGTWVSSNKKDLRLDLALGQTAPLTVP